MDPPRYTPWNEKDSEDSTSLECDDTNENMLPSAARASVGQPSGSYANSYSPSKSEIRPILSQQSFSGGLLKRNDINAKGSPASSLWSPSPKGQLILRKSSQKKLEKWKASAGKSPEGKLIASKSSSKRQKSKRESAKSTGRKPKRGAGKSSGRKSKRGSIKPSGKESKREPSKSLGQKPIIYVGEPIGSSTAPGRDYVEGECECCCCCDCHRCPCEIEFKKMKGAEVSESTVDEWKERMIGIGAIMYATGQLLAKNVDDEDDQ